MEIIIPSHLLIILQFFRSLLTVMERKLLNFQEVRQVSIYRIRDEGEVKGLSLVFAGLQ